MSGEIYKNKIRIRVNGVLTKDESILLARIKSPVINEHVWMPPGGGLQFGETMKKGLAREFMEETGLEIRVGSLIAVNELVKPPFHAIECYFMVSKERGELKLGRDPEHPDDQQVLKELQWIAFDELNEMDIAPAQLQKWVISEHLQKNICHFEQ